MVQVDSKLLKDSKLLILGKPRVHVKRLDLKEIMGLMRPTQLRRAESLPTTRRTVSWKNEVRVESWRKNQAAGLFGNQITDDLYASHSSSSDDEEWRKVSSSKTATATTSKKSISSSSRSINNNQAQKVIIFIN